MADRKLWRTLADAMRSRVFNDCRGIMGTANRGQDEALWRALEHFHEKLYGIDQAALNRFHKRLDELCRSAGNVGGVPSGDRQTFPKKDAPK